MSALIKALPQNRSPNSLLRSVGSGVWLHAAVREEAPDGDGLDAVGLELVLEVRARERVQALLALHHDLRMGREAGGGGGGKRR